jgi:hypothetical protein
MWSPSPSKRLPQIRPANLRRLQIALTKPASHIMRSLHISAWLGIDSTPICKALPAELVPASRTYESFVNTRNLEDSFAAGVGGGELTSHVEASIPLLNVNPTICAGTVLAVALHPVPRLLVLRIAVLLLRIVLVAGQATVPGDLVCEAHFKVA